MTESPTLYKVRQVADHFGVTNRTVIDWVKKGRLQALRLASGQMRIVGASFQGLLRPAPGKRTR